MRKLFPITAFLVAGLVLGLASCSKSDSPTAPRPSPTPQTVSVSLTVSATTAVVGEMVEARATVRSGSAPVADGTPVRFVVAGGAFTSGVAEATVTTQGGIASVGFTANQEGTAQVTATVGSASDSKTVLFRAAVPPPEAPQFYSIYPASGLYTGGYQATIKGKYLCKSYVAGACASPGDAIFRRSEPQQDVALVVASFSGNGEVDTLVVNIPAADPGKVALVLSNGVGTASPVNEAFEYVTSPQVTYEPAGPPQFIGVTPSQGSARGGYTVVVKGNNLCKAYLVSSGECAAPGDVVFRQVLRVVAEVRVKPDGTIEVVYKEINRDVTAVVVGYHGTGRGDELTVRVPEADALLLDEGSYTNLVLNNGLASGGELVVNNAFYYQPDLQKAGAPRVFSVTPNQGSWQGGELVRIRGENLCVYYLVATNLCKTEWAPSVLFELSNETRSAWAEVVSVAADGRELTVRTPRASLTAPTQDVYADVGVRNLVAADTQPRAFRYPVAQLPPQIFSVVPPSGSARGGEQVAINGANFVEPVKVAFSPGGTAEVISVLYGGTQIVVRTPQNSVPLDTDTVASVSVTTEFGTGRDQTVTKANAFTFKAEVTTPRLYALAPNSGPIEGGTRVTIFGTGFQAPVQVLFGDRQAQVISSNFNEIVCIAPSIAPSQPGSPTTVQVSVVNVLTGKVSDNTLPYRYGEAMFISAITPNTGYILGWNPATIYGQGFVAPVQVEVTAGGITKQAEVLSVSGTSIQVKMPPFAELVGDAGCAPAPATFKVTNVGSNLNATGPSYTYLCSGGISGP